MGDERERLNSDRYGKTEGHQAEDHNSSPSSLKFQGIRGSPWNCFTWTYHKMREGKDSNGLQDLNISSSLLLLEWMSFNQEIVKENLSQLDESSDSAGINKKVRGEVEILL